MSPLPDECRCSRCGRRCGTCDCPPVRKQRPKQIENDRKRARKPKRQAYQEQRRADALRDGICITCQKRPAVKGSTRCRRCLDRVARQVWIGKLAKSILWDARFLCEHGDSPETCAACGRCVRAWIRENEDHLRERVRQGRSQKIRAAAAARDLWFKRRKGQRQFVRIPLSGV